MQVIIVISTLKPKVHLQIGLLWNFYTINAILNCDKGGMLNQICIENEKHHISITISQNSEKPKISDIYV